MTVAPTPVATSTTTGAAISSPASVTHLVVIAPPAVRAGSAFSVSVAAEDAAGQVVPSFSGGLTLVSSDGQTVQVEQPATFSQGMAFVAVTLDTADVVSLSAITDAGTIRGSSGLITNSAAPLADFVVSAPASTTTGVGFPVTITAKDGFGNIVTNYSGSVSLTTNDGQSVDMTAPPVFNDGTAVVTVALTRADTLTLNAAAGGAVGTSGAIVNQPATVSTFVVSAPATTTAGTSARVMITAEDASGDTVTGFDGAVTLTISDGQPVPCASPLVFNEGTAVANVDLTGAGSLTLIATCGAAQGTSNSIAVSPAAASTVTVTAPSTVLACGGLCRHGDR